jgi:hypothetical protein
MLKKKAIFLIFFFEKPLVVVKKPILIYKIDFITMK